MRVADVLEAAERPVGEDPERAGLGRDQAKLRRRQAEQSGTWAEHSTLLRRRLWTTNSDMGLVRLALWGDNCGLFDQGLQISSS